MAGWAQLGERELGVEGPHRDGRGTLGPETCLVGNRQLGLKGGRDPPFLSSFLLPSAALSASLPPPASAIGGSSTLHWWV